MTDQPATDQPLWRVMQDAHERDTGSIIDHLGQSVLGEPDHGTYGAMIEAMRDRIVPEEPEPYSPHLPEFLRWRSLLWCGYNQRQYIRALLTTEAEKARVGE